MLGTEKPQTATFQDDYARSNDFCQVFEKEMKTLYLLAFLLTSNHKDAEQCFTLTIEDAFKEQTIFKDWAQSWVKRSLIKNAIQIVSPTSPRSAKRDFWNAGGSEMHQDSLIDAVTRLAPMERFVFVMSVLEGLSVWDSTLLLGCSLSKVAQARTRALRRLPAMDKMFADVGSPVASLLELTA